MDPHSFYLLDPDPHKMNADPQPWFERNCPQSSINHIIVGTNCRLVFFASSNSFFRIKIRIISPLCNNWNG